MNLLNCHGYHTFSYIKTWRECDASISDVFEVSIQISFGFLVSEIGSYNLKLRNLVELVKGFSCKISSPNWNSPGKIIFM